MTSKEFLGTNPFCYKYIIGPFSRCKQEIKWACESSQIVINTHCMTIDELADLMMPDIAVWKPLLKNEGDAEVLQNAFTINEVFVEDQLRKISALTGIPIFDDALVFEDCF